MRLAISNIAWQPHEDVAVRALMQSLGVQGLEVAPTKVWAEPLAASPHEIRAYRRFWASRGIEIVALQALLFGRSDLTLFGPSSVRAQTLEYLTGMVRLCAQLGAKVLVFGSPKNRLRQGLDDKTIDRQAVSFFRALADVAERHGVMFCIEPNPATYGCDFVTTAEEGIALVSAVDHPAFALHLDSGGMTLSGESATTIQTALPVLRHFHVSEPDLEALGARGVDHLGFGHALKTSGFQGWKSIEMRAASLKSCVQSIGSALEFALTRYA